ncbi:hypothetical protein, partial [Rahnella aceris]|uniref:hypothetical protein n=1 Tax=Rahnella sp. (strain Y9602) TaxID=2703885 RepID=UPI0036473B69
ALDTRQKKVDISRYGLDDVDVQGARPPVAPSLTPADTASVPSSSPARVDLPSEPAAEVGKPGIASARTPAEMASPAEAVTEPSLSRERVDFSSEPAIEVGGEGNAPVRMTAEAVSLPEPGQVTPEKSTGAKDAPAEPPIVKPETQAGRNRLQARWDQQMADLNFNIQDVMDAAQTRAVT